MKLPNGYGSVYRLKGNRRNPYMVVLTQGYISTKMGLKRMRVTLGYFSTKKEALTALTNYHENPYDIKVETITFEELYERWSEEHFKKWLPVYPFYSNIEKEGIYLYLADSK